MRIGLISDTHNDLQRLNVALERFKQENINVILHAGDITKPAILEAMAGFAVWFAKGNMDRNPQLNPTVKRLFGAEHWGYALSLEFDGVAIALTHGDSWRDLDMLIHSGKYQYVICGHTHRPQDERVGTTRVINPGSLGSPRWTNATYAILNLATDDLTWIEVQ